MTAFIQKINISSNYGTFIVSLLGIGVIISLLAPRFMAFWPGIASIFIMATYWVGTGSKFQFNKKDLCIPLTIVVMAALSSLWAIDPDYSLKRAAKLGLILIPGSLLVLIALKIPIEIYKPHAHWFFKLISVGVFVCILEILLDYPIYRVLHGIPLFECCVPHASQNRTITALLCLAFAGLGIARFLNNRKYGFILLGLVAVMLLLTESQSAQLGSILAILFYFFFPYSKPVMWKSLSVLLAILVLVAPFIVMWLFTNFAASIERLPFIGFGGGFGAQRLEIWDAAARYALQSPIYGFGIEAARNITDFDIAQIYRKSSTMLHPHNFAIQIWLEFGLMGAILMSALLVFLVIKVSEKPYEQARICLSSMILLLSFASFSYGLWQSWFLGLILYTMSAVILVERLLSETEQTSKDK